MLSSEGLFGDLVGQLYRSVVDHDAIDGFTAMLQAAIPGGAGVLIRRIDRHAVREDPLSMAGFDPDFLGRFDASMPGMELFRDALYRLPINVPATTRTHMDVDRLKKTIVYNEWLAPQGYGLGSIGINIANTDRYVLTLSVDLTEEGLAAVHPQMSVLLQRLAPHLREVASLSGRAWAQGTSAAVDSMAHGAILVSSERRVIHVNAAAERLLRETSVFIDRHGRLRGLTPYAQGVVEDAVGAVASGREPSRTMRLADFGPLGDLLLTVAHLPPDLDGPRMRFVAPETVPSAIIYLATDHDRAAAAVPRIQTAYALSEIEAFFAFSLYCGMKLEQSAALTGIGVYEARLQIDRVMKKMDAGRYADVVRMVAKVMPSV